MADEYFHYPQDAVNEFTRQLNEEIAVQLKALLEEKHLYQKVSVDSQKILDGILARVPRDRDRQLSVHEGTRAVLNSSLMVATGPVVSVAIRGEGARPIAVLTLRNVRLFCTNCDQRNVFSPVWFQDATNEMGKRNLGGEAIERNFDVVSVQLIFVAYQCQHCKGAPDGVLIRREGWKFSLDGRSPMEHIEFKYIPAKESALFRDAMIAWHAGKWLAAVFYLRCFIEQFARRQTGTIRERKTGDEIMDAYAQTLPADKRSHLPTLKEWYDKLSGPIHAADKDTAEKLFDTARQAIENHFEIRRALRIPET